MITYRRAEQDARDRLGLTVAGEPHPIEAAIGLRYPAPVENAYDIDGAIVEARLSCSALYEDGSRFPTFAGCRG